MPASRSCWKAATKTGRTCSTRCRWPTCASIRRKPCIRCYAPARRSCRTAVSPIRLITHLPPIVLADCALRVGGEIHQWQAGRCVTFDDTFEHEAWNRSGETRVVLILDCWNPDLSDAGGRPWPTWSAPSGFQPRMRAADGDRMSRGACRTAADQAASARLASTLSRQAPNSRMASRSSASGKPQ